MGDGSHVGATCKLSTKPLTQKNSVGPRLLDLEQKLVRNVDPFVKETTIWLPSSEAQNDLLTYVDQVMFFEAIVPESPENYLYADTQIPEHV